MRLNSQKKPVKEHAEDCCQLTLGFPQWQVAMICQDGNIKAFPIDGSEYSSFPKLPKKKFGYFYNR